MHKGRVKYAQVRLPGGTPLPDGWTVISVDPFAVAGPCPQCLGDAYGPVLQVDDPGARELVESAPVATVIAECQCGYGHGEDGAKGCGRYWPVSIAATAHRAAGDAS